MEIFLNFVTKNQKLPLDYRSTFLSFFKNALSIFGSGKWGQRFYIDNSRKPFTFAVNLPSPKFSKQCIKLASNELSLTFSTADNYIGYIFMCAFEAQVNKVFKIAFENEITLKRVKVSRGKSVNNNKIIVKMCSPLCLRKHNKITNEDFYYSVESEDFNKHSKEILEAQLISEGFPRESASNIKITPIDCKKTVVLHYGTYIECSLGVFKIEADPSVLNQFLQNGLGSRKSAGFGFAKLISNLN